MSFFMAFINRQFIYTPPVPAASFEGKTIIVTGGNGGLGLEAARWFVQLGASRVILACRNVHKGKVAAQEIQSTTSCSPNTLEVWPLDLSSYASVLAFADRITAEIPRLDALLGNAGIWCEKFALTEDNEESVTTNVVSMALLGFLLYPKLRDTAAKFNTETYFTVTGSELYEVAKLKERRKVAAAGGLFAALNTEEMANMGDRYNVTKLLVILIIRQMASMAPVASGHVIINCVAPGFCQSGLGANVNDGTAVRLFKKYIGRPAEVGARTLVHGASAGPESHGEYIPDCKITAARGLAAGPTGAELQAQLWGELKQKLEAIRAGLSTLS